MLERYLSRRTAGARPPLTLGTRAARYGAAAVLIAVAIFAIPVAQGYRSGPGDAATDPTPWQALQQMGRDMATKR